MKAVKRTVSLTIDAGICAEAKQLEINLSEVAEEALAREVARRRSEVIRREIQQDLEACDAYWAEHGSFVELVREHYQTPDAAPRRSKRRA